MITADQARITTANNKIRLMAETQRTIEEHEGYSELFSFLFEKITNAAVSGASSTSIPVKDLGRFNLNELRYFHIYLNRLGYKSDYHYWDDSPRDLVISW
jgi:hypothetical protein